VAARSSQVPAVLRAARAPEPRAPRMVEHMRSARARRARRRSRADEVRLELLVAAPQPRVADGERSVVSAGEARRGPRNVEGGSDGPGRADPAATRCPRRGSGLGGASGDSTDTREAWLADQAKRGKVLSGCGLLNRSTTLARHRLRNLDVERR